jgi:hypothetical protein
MIVPTDPRSVHVTAPRVEARAYQAPNRTVLLLLDGPYLVAEFTSAAALVRALGDSLADLAVPA